MCRIGVSGVGGEFRVRVGLFLSLALLNIGLRK
jgi:hypothetical protein